jgi:hypothetical protein
MVIICAMRCASRRSGIIATSGIGGHKFRATGRGHFESAHRHWRSLHIFVKAFTIPTITALRGKRQAVWRLSKARFGTAAQFGHATFRLTDRQGRADRWRRLEPSSRTEERSARLRSWDHRRHIETQRARRAKQLQPSQPPRRALPDARGTMGTDRGDAVHSR